MELKSACEPCCSCCEIENGVDLVIVTESNEHHFLKVREYEISTFVDYFRRTHKVKQVRINY